MVEDGENVKVDYAFDNPAFKGMFLQTSFGIYEMASRLSFR